MLFFFLVFVFFFPEVVPLYCNGPTWGSSRQCVILLSISVLFGEKIRWVGWVLLGGMLACPREKSIHYQAAKLHKSSEKIYDFLNN